MSSGLPFEAQRLLELAPSADLLEEWNPEPGSDSTAELQRLVLPMLHGAPGEALRVIEHVLVVPPRSLEAHALARIDRLHAHTLKATGELVAANRVYARASKSFETLADPVEIARTAIGWADALALLGRFEEGEKVIQRGLECLPSRAADLRARLDAVSGTLAYLAGRYDVAQRRFRRARRRAARRGRALDAAICHYNLGNIELIRGHAAAASREFSRARDTFTEHGFALAVDQCRYGEAAVALLRADWEEGLSELQDLSRTLLERGDRRGSALVDLDAAQLLAQLGALGVADRPARRAATALREMGLIQDWGRACEIHGRILAGRGRIFDARRRLEQARSCFEALDRRDRVWALRMSAVELALELPADAAPRRELFDELQRVLRHARRADRRELEVRGRYARLRLESERGRTATVLRLGQELYRGCARGERRLRRPDIALLVAGAFAARDQSPDAVRWARRAVADLEGVVTRFGERATSAGISAVRDRVASLATEVVLAHGGRRAVSLAVELLLRARASGVVEDLLRGRARTLDEPTRRALARLRDQLLDADGGPDDVRGRALRREVDRLEQTWNSSRGPALRSHRELAQSCAPPQWIAELGPRTLVIFDRTPRRWQAFVISKDGETRYVPLPDAQTALEASWVPLRMLFEAIARAPRPRRTALLARSEDEARQQLRAIGDAFWRPLELQDSEVVFVPDASLHGVPLESALLESAGDRAPVAARLPHPALLRRAGRRRHRRALLLQGTVQGAAREISMVERRLGESGWTTTVEDSRDALLHCSDRLDLLHVAAHGAFHRSDWVANGLRLRDGWLGFEQLDEHRVRGALLFFDSCESGLAQDAPATELDSWVSAGLGAGADELVLTLWKIDDEAARAFSGAFYRRWSRGTPAPRAADHARRERRRKRPHPYHWGAHVVASRRSEA